MGKSWFSDAMGQKNVLQFSIQYRIVPKSESGHLWQLFLPVRQISAIKRTTWPIFIFLSTGGNKITIEYQIIDRQCYFKLWYSRDLNLAKRKYVWDIPVI